MKVKTEKASLDHAPEMQPKSLLLMALLHFIAMYFLMFSMVDGVQNIFTNLNNFYMAGIMTAPMLIIEIILMGTMYKNKKAINAIFFTSIILFLILFTFIRRQTAIDDKEFLRSMIPHHAGAILMCEEAPLTDPEIKDLCQQIIASQESEIAQMKTILERLR